MLDSSILPLENSRARLRQLHSTDAVAYAEGTGDPVVQQFGHLPEPEYSPESVRTMIEQQVNPGLEQGVLAVLAIARPETDSFAGSLVIFDVSDPKAEVGFWIHPAHRGSNLADAALKLSVEFARKSGLDELTARTVPENLASQRVLETAGFTLRDSASDIAPSGHRSELLQYSCHLL